MDGPAGAGHDTAVVRAEDDAVHVAPLMLQSSNQGPAFGIPKPCIGSAGPRHEATAVRAENGIADGASTIHRLANLGSCSRIPELCSLSKTGQEPAVVRAKDLASRSTIMFARLADLCAARSVPKPRGLVPGTCEDATSVGAEDSR